MAPVAGSTKWQRWASWLRGWAPALLCVVFAHAAAAQTLALTERERAWVAAHPVVRVALTREFPPYYFNDERSGHPHGFVVEMLDLWSQRSGLRFEYRHVPRFADALDALRRGEIDMLPFAAPLPQIADAALYTRAAFTTNLVLAARRDVPDVSPTADFGGRRVAAVADSAALALLRDRHPQAAVHTYERADEALRALAGGQVDLFIGFQHEVVFHVEKNLLANVELRRNLGPGAAPLGPAVRRDLPELRAILDRAIESVTAADRSRLAERWLPAGALVPLPPTAVELTAAERAWLRQHGRIRVGYDADFAPFTQRGPLGEFQGLGADALRLAAGKVGLEIVQEIGASFAEVYDGALAGSIEVVVGVARTPLRRRDVDFVGPFASVPTALFTAVDGAAVTDTAQVGLRRLALLRAHFLIPELRARHPGIQLVELDRQDQVLAAVAEGAAQVGLGNLKVVNDLIERRFAGQLRITGVVRGGDSELYFAVPRRLPELTRLLHRGFEALDDSERATLQARWMTVQVKAGIDWARVASIALPVLAALLAYLYLLARGNRRLRAAREVEREARRVAEQATAARGRFLAYLSHELRGGLGAVSAGAEMLRDHDDPALRDRLLDAIARSSQGLRQVLDDTLAYEQLVGAPLLLDIKPTAMTAFWAQALAAGELAAQARDLRLERDVQRMPQTLAIDATRLQQVVQNLVHNAVKFARRGPVAVRAETRERGGRLELCIEVLDDGPGLSAADLERLFEPYAQGEQGRAHRQGAGLGLAISRQIVTAMGGRIDAGNRDEGGAVFRVAVPVEAPTRPAGGAVSLAAGGTRVGSAGDGRPRRGLGLGGASSD